MIQEQNNRPICSTCNKAKCKKNGLSTKGFQKYSKYCNLCEKKFYNLKANNRRIGYAIHKKDICEKCGFIPEHTCQLDVDHIDNNKLNNDISNLQTLCANCHRLKTHLNDINPT